MLRRSIRIMNASLRDNCHDNKSLHSTIRQEKLHLDRAAKEFYISVNQEKAVVEYERIDSKTLDLVHTRVPKALRGQGIGKILAKEVFEFCQAHDIRVKFSCSFLQDYYDKNKNIYEGINFEDSEKSY